MKLSRIEIRNVLGLHRADLDITTPVLMVLGANEAGKSSLSDAISMAVLGQPRRVKLKKELGQLLHDDAKKGRVTLLAEGEVFGEYKLPSGDQTCNTVPGADFLPYVISPELTARLDEKALRSMLFSLTQYKASPDVTAKLMLERGCRADFVEEIKPLLRGGSPAAAKDAAERATQLKGAWRGVTGENWGSDKGANWAPDVSGDPIDQKEIDGAARALSDTEAHIEEGTKQLGMLEQKRKDAAVLAERRTQLEGLAGTLKRATDKKEATDKDLAQWEAKFADLSEKLKAARAGSVSVQCPCCSERLRIVGQALEKFDGAEADPKLAQQLNTDLVKAQNAVSLLRSTSANDARDIAAAEDATAQLGILQQQQGAPVDQAKIDSFNEALNKLRQQRDGHRAKVQALQERQQDLMSAETNTKRALAYHLDCMGWLKISEALSPAGIPATILSTAIKPVNDSLAILSRLSGWKKVEITADMEITADGRLYGLMSESAKWRIDTLLALAIAQISELRFVVLDRFDVLDMVGRKQLFGMLIQLDQMKLMDQSIVCGTLKEPIKGMPASIGQVWINRGIAEGTAQ